jgi:ABC-type sugar transport system ATPase subunit/ribose/xylose/arabinose/galactoside ABC-type transport system permease subunit
MTVDAAASVGEPRAPVDRSEPVMRLIGVTKKFPGVTALDNVDFDCRPGEIHALVGENGSGKSTLLKVAAGIWVPEQGMVEICGEPLRGGDPRESRKLGLMTAYQDTSLIGELSVAENIRLSFHSLGEAPPKNIGALLKKFDLPCSPRSSVKSLGPGGRQMLEVVRLLAHSPRILVLDEPTAALDMQTASSLHEVIKTVRDEGVSIVYVSHRLEEVRRLADRLSVLRDGVVRGTYERMDWAVEEIVELMVGTRVGLEFPERTSPPSSDRPVLDIRDLQGSRLGPVSLTVNPGEIVGIAGAEGSGQRDLLHAIIGIGRKAGEVRLGDRELKRTTPRAALKAGVTYQSGDRAAESIFIDLSVLDNATIQADRGLGPFGLSLPRPRLSKLRSVVSRLGIVNASPYQPIGGLSGGNQQKVVLSRAALRRPKLLMVDEPSQGVDARARLDIYRILAEEAADGVGVLVNSSDSLELAGLCDRVYVMADGMIIDEVTGELSEPDIVRRFVSNKGENKRGDEGSGSYRVVSALASPQVPVVLLLVMLAALLGYTNQKAPFFMSSFNMSNVLLLACPLMVVAVGQMMALLTAEFDISVGASMTLSVIIASEFLETITPQSLAKALCVMLALAFAVGLFNAFLTRVLGVNPIVATIAATGILTGIAILLRPQPAGSVDFELNEWISQTVGFVPWIFITILVCAVGADVWLYRTGRGLSVRAVGLNSDFSRRVGIRTGLTKSVGYLVAAVGAVTAGFLLAGQVGIGSNDVALNYALPAFAACFLAGAALSGGRGSFTGAAVGAVFLTVLINATQAIGMDYEMGQIFYGLILVVATTVYSVAARRAAQG